MSADTVLTQADMVMVQAEVADRLAAPVLTHADMVLAHYGGAPEVLTIALPVVIFTGFLLLERRARQREREQPGSGSQHGPGDA